MDLNSKHFNEPLSAAKPGGFSHEHKAVLMTAAIVLLVFIVGSMVWAIGYSSRLAPNLMIGSVNVGGMNEESATELLQQTVDELITIGIPMIVDSENVQLPLATLVTTDVIEDVKFDVEAAIQRAFSYKRSENIILDTGLLLYQIVRPAQISIIADVSEDNIRQSVYGLFPEKETLAIDASFVFVESGGDWSVTAKEGVSGIEFDFDPFFDSLKYNLKLLRKDIVELNLITKSPLVSLDEANKQTEGALLALNKAPITFTHQNQYKQNLKWTLSKTVFSNAIVPTKSLEVSLNKEVINTFFEPIANQIERKARDAKIDINNGRVTSFIESRDGIVLDKDVAYNTLIEILEGEDISSVKLVTQVEEPLVKTGDVNDLGITEVLGTGTSSYVGSPWNRKRNIQNGVNLLNGILIPPGEEFSLIDALAPFTIENGYLPELVIKGDKIKPEIGGGLCQIGTTTFRTTMNSGLKVTDRRNHSLVVSYYNDPSNGNPGTDATIYDPAPNYKFLNDTEHHVLFQAENLTATQELRFTFWGTSDGRVGSYIPPTVLKWIPVGEERIIETTDLEPGVKECQFAHIGADTTFDYTVLSLDGTKEVVTYESHYRPLPKICLLGIEKEVEEESPEELGPPSVQTIEVLQ
jgi:vancomycin resistance protein YoaR